MTKRRKIILAIVLIPVGLIVASAIFLAILFLPQFNQLKPIIFGATFSEPYTKYLGLDWQKTYLAVLDDLKVKNLRLIAPWDEIEPAPGKYDFTDLDWQIKEAEKRSENCSSVGRASAALARMRHTKLGGHVFTTRS